MLLRGFRFLHLISVSCSLMGGGRGMVVASFGVHREVGAFLKAEFFSFKDEA